jgi:hypothetical protein
MQLYTVYFCLQTALHVSGGTSTHHQERINFIYSIFVFVTPLLLPAAFVEKMELPAAVMTAAGNHKRM